MKYICIFLISLLLSSCASSKVSGYLKNKISSSERANDSKQSLEKFAKKFSDLSGWANSDKNHTIISGFKAFSISCDIILKRDDDYKIGLFAGYVYDWKDVCKKNKRLANLTQKLSGKNNEKLYKRFFENNFVPFLISNNNNSQGLFTGYYLPELNGSYQKTDRYRYPIYKTPKNKDIFHSNFKNFSREKINRGALEGKNLELLYVDDQIDLFFLHIQGSGRVRLENDKIINVGYDGQNGYRYNSIGRLMVEEGIFQLEEVTAQKIKKWLRENPDKIISTLDKNPSYIFFKIHKHKETIGAQGIPLTPEGSLAIDNSFIPYGIPIWLDTELANKKKYQRLFVSQDTGGAIKGVIRGDIFFGFGKRAEKLAGEMRSIGQYYILLPKNIAYR